MRDGDQCFGADHILTTEPDEIFAPASTPADAILDCLCSCLAVTGRHLRGRLRLAGLRGREVQKQDATTTREPPQVYGSNQVKLAWTVIPILIVVALFLATARVIAGVQKAERPASAIEVVAIGHQFWWEYRYPGLNVVTANELHVPVSDPAHPTPTFLTLLSADTDHSFWVPRLAGKTDLIPNRIQPACGSTRTRPGSTSASARSTAERSTPRCCCAFTSQPREEFDRWIQEQQQPAARDAARVRGRHVFETTACINCHAVAGTAANGRFGPDLTHLMSRDTIASGAAPNTPENLRRWIQNPDAIKPGSRMPAMELSDRELDAVAAYLETLR